ncbi:hypothetical protein Lalb_Chr05g0226911 [Lupinus albus]|uniref:Uncharacterized protein n=1 Tax=Lupinus albus TaxID=3870 RepID=A0A6A4QKV7_LUPAL|nr:hypothetical protein Lalb_Chr05g0226911 [Lupinus albus]
MVFFHSLLSFVVFSPSLYLFIFTSLSIDSFSSSISSSSSSSLSTDSLSSSLSFIFPLLKGIHHFVDHLLEGKHSPHFS